MTDWYEIPYPGGPMVAVRGFPRVLYPPDAKPEHTPSENGDDVVAYKRTVSRAGRWEWSEFDKVFSNGFSHGKTGGNVRESGIAGIQRQGNINPPTGWVGESTFNLLRSIRIPEGLPNAGEPAMDDYAAELINKAHKKYHAPAGTLRQAALKLAISQIGVKESPFGTNRVKYSQWYGMRGPWCAMFDTWCFEIAAALRAEDSPSFVRGAYYAYVPYVVSDARSGRRGLSTTTNPIPGDLVAYDWRRDGLFDHIGIFEKGTGFSWTAIEGNTSLGNNSNGGQVMRRSRTAGDANTVFIRVEESA